MTSHVKLAAMPVTVDRPVRVATFETYADATPLEATWRVLEASGIGHVFAGFDFISPWAAHVAPERNIDPRIVVGRDSTGRVLCILPFGLRRRYGLRILQWLGDEYADYPGGLFTADLIAALATDAATSRGFRNRAFAAAGRVDLVSLTRQPATLDGHPNPFVEDTDQRNPSDAHETALGGDWETYYQTKRQSNSRRNDRKKLKRIEASGPIRFVVAETPSESAAIMAALFDQKSRSLTANGVCDMFANTSTRRFYQAVAERRFPAGPTFVAALYCGSTIVATNWALIHGNRFYYVMHAYAAGEIARSSPGRHLMYRMMEWCIAQRINVFDFTIGDEGYKDDWCEVTTPLYVAIRGKTPQGMVAALLVRSAIHAKRLIKTTPALWRAVNAFRRSKAGFARNRHAEHISGE